MKHDILIDLDVLFDTRLGVIGVYDEHKAASLVNSDWRNRVADDPSLYIPDISKEMFDELYKARNKSALMNTTLTTFIIEFGDIVFNLQNLIAADLGRIKESNILLNLYPYTDLNEEEIKGFVAGLHAYIGHEIPIKPVFYKPSDLSMMFLRSSEIMTYITYDYGLWLRSIFNEETGREAITPYPSLTVIAPELLPETNTMDKFDGNDIKLMGNRSVFEFMKLYWSPMFKLQFYPINVMSIIDTTLLKD